jgi:hypothetical protein
MTKIKRNWRIIGILLPAVWVLVSATPAGAETVKFKLSTYLVKLEWSPVGDAEGHVIGFFSRRGLAFIENGEVATYSNRGTFDYTKGEGSYEGYSKLTYEDGSTTVQKFKGTATKIEGTKYKSSKGTGEYIKGTGRFEGIKGTVSFAGKNIMPYSKEKGTCGDSYYDVTGKYTLPSK